MKTDTTRHSRSLFIASAGMAAILLFVIAVLGSLLVRQVALPGNVIFLDIQHYALSFLVYAGILSAWISGSHISAAMEDKRGNEGKNGNTDNRVFVSGWIMCCVILPFSIVLLVSLPDVLSAWETVEASRQQGGLPGLFLVKTALPGFCAAVILVALARARRVIRRTQ